MAQDSGAAALRWAGVSCATLCKGGELEYISSMGQGLSCAASQEHGLFSAVQFGDLDTVKAMLEKDSSFLHQTTVYDRQSALHIAAANGQIEVGFVVFTCLFIEFLFFFFNA